MTLKRRFTHSSRSPVFIFISQAFQYPALWRLFILILLLYFDNLYHASLPFQVLLSDRVIFSDLSGNYFSNVVIIVLRVRPVRMRYLRCEVPLGLNCHRIYSCSKGGTDGLMVGLVFVELICPYGMPLQLWIIPSVQALVRSKTRQRWLRCTGPGINVCKTCSLEEP